MPGAADRERVRGDKRTQKLTIPVQGVGKNTCAESVLQHFQKIRSAPWLRQLLLLLLLRGGVGRGDRIGLPLLLLTG